MKPKKYSLETNRYGNLDSQPTGWMTFTDAGITKHSKHHRAALESGRIFSYEVIRGFHGGSRHGWSPILEPIIHRDQMPLFWRLVLKSQDASKKQAKIKARVRAKLVKTPEYQQEMEARRKKRRDAAAALKERRKEQAAEEHRLDMLCKEAGIRCDRAGRLLAWGLRDITEAHPSWLDDAYQAILDGERYDGVMLQYLDGRNEDRSYFHYHLCRAIGAHRRHNDTNYDDLLAKGYTRDEAMALRE